MAQPIEDYDDLKDAIADELGRDDLTDQIPAFIQRAEDRMKRLLRRKVRRMTVTIDAVAGCVPVQAAILLSGHLMTGSPQLDKPFNVVTATQLAEIRANQGGVGGRPRWAAIVGQEILFAPAPDGSYDAELTFVAALQRLSASNTKNDELTEASDMYLYGSLVQAEMYLEHDDRIEMWKAQFSEAIEELNTLRSDEEHSMSLQPVRLPIVFS